jgi:hypothetical protein
MNPKGIVLSGCRKYPEEALILAMGSGINESQISLICDIIRLAIAHGEEISSKISFIRCI